MEFKEKPDFGGFLIDAVRSLRNVEDISLDTTFLSLDLDSFAVFSLVSYVESLFGLQFDEEQLVKIAAAERVGDVVSIVGLVWGKAHDTAQ